MDFFTVLDLESANNGGMEPTVPNAEVEFTKGYWLTLDRNEMFARYGI